jgi:hypothetical protein
MTTNRLNFFFKFSLLSNNPKKIALTFGTPRSHANFNSRNLARGAYNYNNGPKYETTPFIP